MKIPSDKQIQSACMIVLTGVMVWWMLDMRKRAQAMDDETRLQFAKFPVFPDAS